MKKFSNVQKSENLKKEDYNLATRNKLDKINILDSDIEAKLNNQRYQNVGKLFIILNSKLDKKLPFNVRISCLSLEALAKASMSYTQKEFEKLILQNITPINFFRLVTDISMQITCPSSRKIAQDYLESEKSLKRLNRFYNEYSDIFNECQKYHYSSLYLFNLVIDNAKANNTPYTNIFTLLHSDDKRKRHIVCNIINEMENETRKNYITEDTVFEYHHKFQKIDKNIEMLFSKIDLNSLYSIDYLYENI